jgi:hypothetical protein
MAWHYSESRKVRSNRHFVFTETESLNIARRVRDRRGRFCEMGQIDP